MSVTCVGQTWIHVIFTEAFATWYLDQVLVFGIMFGCLSKGEQRQSVGTGDCNWMGKGFLIKFPPFSLGQTLLGKHIELQEITLWANTLKITLWIQWGHRSNKDQMLSHIFGECRF